MASRIVTLAASSAVIVTMLAILPAGEQQIANAGTDATETTAFTAVTETSAILIELTPLVAVALAAGFALFATGVLGGRR
jgi:hypothetical protein